MRVWRRGMVAIAALTVSLFAWPLTSAQAAAFQGRYQGTTGQGFAYSMSVTNAPKGEFIAGTMLLGLSTKIVMKCPNGSSTDPLPYSFSPSPFGAITGGHFSGLQGGGPSLQGGSVAGVFSGDRVTGTMHVKFLIKGKMCTTGLIRFTATRTSSVGTTAHPTTKTVACPNWNDFSNLTLYTKVHATAITCAQARIVERGFLYSLHQGSGPSGPVHVGTFTCRDHLRLGINRLSGAGSCVNGAGGSVTFVATVLAQ